MIAVLWERAAHSSTKLIRIVYLREHRMDDRIFDQIQEVDLQKTMEESYIDYAMSVSGCQRRSEAGAEKSSVFDDRTEQRS